MKCKICSDKFKPTYFNQKHCDKIDCKVKWSIQVVEKNKIAKQNKDKKDWKAEKSILKEKLKTLSQYESEAKIAFQKYIRLRDSLLPCISCGIKVTDLWDGGHFKKAEIYSGVIFDEANCHKQCRKCNRFLNGNELNYRLGLIKRYGVEYADNIERKANELRQFKWTKEQLIAKKIQYEIKIKEYLKK